MGCVRVAVVSWPLSRWPVGSLLTRTEDRRGRGREGSDWAERWFAAKRKTCLVVLPKNSRTMLQFKSQAAEGKRVCLLALCVGTPLSLFIPTTPLCVNKVWKKSAERKQSL